MAKEKAKAGAAGKGNGLEPYPKKWGAMTKDERAEWMKKYRPDRPTGVAVKPVVQPAKAAPAVAAPAPGGQHESAEKPKNLVRIEVESYTVTVGTREPVTCPAAELLYTVDAELDAWEDENRPEEGTPTEGEGEKEDS